MWLLKRKPGVTFEHFRNHYETRHSVLGQQYFGHLMTGYTRNYNVREEGSDRYDSMLSDYDCVTEWEFPDEAAFEEFLGVLGDPEIGAIFREDETHFLDSAATRLVRCQTHDTGPGDGAETLKLRAKAG